MIYVSGLISWGFRFFSTRIYNQWLEQKPFLQEISKKNHSLQKSTDTTLTKFCRETMIKPLCTMQIVILWLAIFPASCDTLLLGPLGEFQRRTLIEWILSNFCYLLEENALHLAWVGNFAETHQLNFWLFKSDIYFKSSAELNKIP